MNAGGKRLLCLSAALAACCIAATVRAEDSAAAKKIFANPPREYATAPLWVWNDMLTEDQIRGTMRDLAGQKVMQVFVHPRPGLMTPYLSDEWFRLWRVALDEAEKLDMNVWIYDENSYPSGFAGGWVPEVMPESRGRGLAFREEKKIASPGPDVIAVYRLSDNGFENVTEKARAGQAMPEARYVVAHMIRATNSPWHGDRCYVDLMYPGVTEKFLEITLDAYKKHVGDQFGKRVLGSFTDEPNINPTGSLPWTENLPAEFQKRWGYSLLDHLPSLTRPVGDWKKVRHDYFQVLLDQYIEHWAKPYLAWCEKNGIAFTGHYWDHEWPSCVGVPDNMAMSAWQHIPGIDCLMNQYSEHTHAQFGNVRFVRELASVANQMGAKRRLCELYGAGGWDLRFEDMKRIADWLTVLGVNLQDEHLSYVTLRGARKNDHPQSFSYHEPWWDSYHVSASYITRLCAAMSMGEQKNRILVIEPTTTAWMYQADPSQGPQLNRVGREFFDFLMTLERAQVEYDLGCEDVMARHGSVLKQQDGQPLQIVVGKRAYSTVVFPPMTETLRGETMKLLEEFAKGGGRILSCGPAPVLVDARASDRGTKLAETRGWKRIEPAGAPAMLVPSLAIDRFAIRRAPGDKGNLFHQRRQLDDGDLLLLVNTSIDAPSKGSVESQAKGIECWDLHTGKTCAYPFRTDGEAAKAEYNLPPCGSLLLFLSKDALTPGQTANQAASVVKASGPTQIRRLEPNVLTLDFVDITAGGETRKNVYFYPANQFAWQKNGMPRNPWDSAVQYKDELIRKKFPAESGFQATYRFKIEGQVPQPLWIVIERPDLYSIDCNGQPIQAAKGEWWLDRAFGKIDITSAAKVGENAVTIKAKPFTIYHELEPAYVLGDFSLKPAQSGFVIAPPQPLKMEKTLAHGDQIEKTMWLSSGVGYQRDPSAREGNDRTPWVVFDLGRPVDLQAIQVWNYNEVNQSGRGVKKMEIFASASGDPDSFTTSLGTFDLARSNGASEKLPVDGRQIRYVRFKILSNQNGVTYPATEAKLDSAFVGLSEVKFLVGQPGKEKQIPRVTIHAVSSELTTPNHDRKAEHMIDGSGLSKGAMGWNQQGMPFYSAGVAYRQTFQVASAEGKYRVSLPAKDSWRGSVAKVIVNGKLCGHIAWQPWECDVTSAIKPGENVVEVVVIGTLKNMLGPHHVGALRGSAWPGSFQQGPKEGPPPGASYDTISYGLFEPFALVRGQ